jgi:hypothetical protein
VVGSVRRVLSIAADKAFAQTEFIEAKPFEMKPIQRLSVPQMNRQMAWQL